MGIVRFKGLIGIVASLTVLGAFSPSYGALKTAKEHIDQGSAFLKAKQLDEAIASFTDALKLSPKSVRALNNRGVAFVMKGDFDRALNDFNRAIQIDPKYGQAYNNRAIALWSLGQPDKAEADIKKAQSLGIKVDKEALARFLENTKLPEKAIPPMEPTKFGDPRVQGEQTPEPVKTFTLEEKQAYQKKIALDLEEIKKKIEELVPKWQEAEQSRKRFIRKDILVLQQLFARAQRTLTSLETASEKDWPYAKISMDSAMNDLIKAVSEIELRQKSSGKAPALPDRAK